MSEKSRQHSISTSGTTSNREHFEIFEGSEVRILARVIVEETLGRAVVLSSEGRSTRRKLDREVMAERNRKEGQVTPRNETTSVGVTEDTVMGEGTQTTPGLERNVTRFNAAVSPQPAPPYLRRRTRHNEEDSNNLFPQPWFGDLRYEWTNFNKSNVWGNRPQ